MHYLTVKQAAERLQISDKTIYQLCAAGRVAHHRIGTGRGTIRISEHDLAAFVADCKVDSGPDANPDALKHINIR